MNRLLLSCLILFYLFLPAIASAEEIKLNIIYTGAVYGELEPCGCSPKTDFGGLARLSGYLVEHAEELSPLILIDAGNFSLKDTPQGRLKAEAILKSYNIMKYDAVAFLRNEGIFPSGFFDHILNQYKLPAVSGMTGYERSVQEKRNDLDLNISIDPAGHLKEKLNILLTDLPLSECKDIKEWDLIITSSGEKLEEPIIINKTVIIAGYPKGEKFGILSLEIAQDGVEYGFKHRWQPLGNTIEEDIRVREVLNAYDKKVAQLLKDMKYISEETTYLGVSKCAECHQLFVESWEKTPHAHAFSSLQESGKSSDPECIVCHVVGFGEKGGFHTIEKTPELANVQCEVCHGLDREHLSDFSRPMKPVTESICIKCHTASNSPDFNFQAYFDKIKH